MKILNFKASKVHGYIDFDIDFNPNLSFIAGLNGSGKTTAINLIVALLTPSFDSLNKIQFATAELKIQKRTDKTVTIKCEKNEDKLILGITGIPDPVVADRSEIELRERRIFLHNRKNDVIREINKLPSPMFLSLDRRFVKGTRKNIKDRTWHHDEYGRIIETFDESSDTSIEEVLKIISEESSSCRAQQVHEDQQLRNKIILDSFNLHKPDGALQLPDQRTIQTLRRKQEAIKKTLNTLDVQGDEYEKRYAEFFDQLEKLLKYIDENNSNRKNKSNEEYQNKIISEWIVNQHQLERINRLFHLVERYQNAKQRIYERLNEFQKLVNKFLEQTRKEILVTPIGEVKIKIAGKERELSILSSGERQILIMLAHLVLNKRLAKDGVFIVDEPELSLHLSWQDMFVDAIQAASPNLQIILATHSPAIVGGRNSLCVPLEGGI